MPDFYDVLMIGAGHGGAQAAGALRRSKFEGSIAIVGEESEIPYARGIAMVIENLMPG